MSRVHVTIDGKSFTIGSTYDAQDREILHTYPDGSSIRIRYNARGQLAGYGRAVDIAYDGDGVEMRRAFNTGVVKETGYDEDRRRTASRVTAADGSIVQALAWTYDAAGNIAQVRDARAGIDAAHDRTETYTLDNLYRLQSVTGAWGHAAMRYSPSGNMVERTSSVPELDAGVLTYGVNAGPHALTGFRGRAITYDALGRMRTDGDRTYAWNAADQLVRVTNASGASVESTFDANGTRRMRVERRGGETHKTYFLDAWSEVEDGKLSRFIVHGGKRIAQENGVPAAGVAREARNGGEDENKGSRAALARVWIGISLNGVALALLAALLARYRELLRRGATVLVPTLAIAAFALVACSGDDDATSPDLTGTVQVLGDADELLFDDAIGSLTEETSGAGAPRATFASYPFGVARFDTSGQTRKYANAPRDGVIGLDQMGARSYAPDLGVWTSADPMALHEPERGVGAAFAANNPYGYAGENPTIAADENGHWLHIVVGALVGGTISAGIEAYRQYSETGHIESYGRIGAKFSVGAAAGGLVAALPSPATIGGVVALGAGESVATGVASRLIDSGGKSAGSFKDAALDAGLGAATAGLAAGGGAVARKMSDAVAAKAAPAVRRAAAGIPIKSGIRGGAAGGETPKIHMGKQGKHIPGHNNFEPGRSVLRADPHLLASRAGTGEPVNQVPVGQPGSKERVLYPGVIGDYVDQRGAPAVATRVGIIHYSKDGIHIVPGRPQ